MWCSRSRSLCLGMGVSSIFHKVKLGSSKLISAHTESPSLTSRIPGKSENIPIHKHQIWFWLKILIAVNKVSSLNCVCVRVCVCVRAPFFKLLLALFLRNEWRRASPCIMARRMTEWMWEQKTKVVWCLSTLNRKVTVTDKTLSLAKTNRIPKCVLLPIYDELVRKCSITWIALLEHRLSDGNGNINNSVNNSASIYGHCICYARVLGDFAPLTTGCKHLCVRVCLSVLKYDEIFASEIYIYYISIQADLNLC